MRELLERFIISSTPAWRVLLAVFASTPFFLIELAAHGVALGTPEMRSALNPTAMWLLPGELVLARGSNRPAALWLSPQRPLPGPCRQG